MLLDESLFDVIRPEDRPGLQMAGTCPVTGRPLWTRPEWSIEQPGYTNRLLLLAPDVIVARSTGRIKLSHTREFGAHFQAILEEFLPGGEKFAFIEDYGGVISAETSARRAYIEFLLARRDRIGALIFHSLSPLMRLFVRLGRKFHLANFPIEVCADYGEAVSCLVAIRRGGALKSNSETGSAPQRTGIRLPLPRRFLDGYAKELGEIFAGLPWDAPGEALNPLPLAHPFHDLVDGWIAVKKDLDHLHSLNREQELRFRQVVETAQEGVWMAQPDGRTTFANERMLSLLGATLETIAATPFQELLPAGRRDEILETLHRGEAQVFEARLPRFDGREAWAIVSASPIRGADGASAGFFAMCTDISLRRLAEEEIRRLNRDLEGRVRDRTAELASSNRSLEEVLRAREEFLAAMSHELRTPLSSILSIAESLRAGVWGGIGPRQDRWVQVLEDNGKHLLSLINDILDLSKSRAGRLGIDVEPIDLVTLARDAHDTQVPVAEAAGVELLFEAEPLPGLFEADPRRIRQIVLNLLSNAIKFTPRGKRAGLTLRASGKRLLVTVWDEGPGIPQESVPQLFQPFVQLDEGNARPRGTGLGLALARNLAQAHGGTIRLETGEGRGCRFTLDLPWRSCDGNSSSAESCEGAEASSEAPRGRTVLVVEDNEDLRETTVEFLRNCGWEVFSAGDGGEALEFLSGKRPDAVVMDVHMPGIDGLEAIRRLRVMPGLATLPVVALTGFAFDADVEKCRKAGANLHLAKPVSLARLSGILEDFIARAC